MHVFLDSRRRLRNGWWMLIFVAFVALTSLAYRPTSQALRALGIDALWLEPLPVLFALAATWACTRLRGEPLASVGLRFDRRWAAQFGLGVGIGSAAMLLIAALLWLGGGVRFTLDPARSLVGLGVAAHVFLWAAVLEELFFRGFFLQRFIAGAGAKIALPLVALLFAAAHLGNPDMQGATMAWASIDLALGAMLLGLAYLRTGSLALPIGLHLAWNWVQGSVLGFGVSGYAHRGWLQPGFTGSQPEWMTGGQFGPEASAVAVLIDALLLLALWRWLRPPVVEAAAPCPQPA